MLVNIQCNAIGPGYLPPCRLHLLVLRSKARLAQSPFDQFIVVLGIPQCRPPSEASRIWATSPVLLHLRP